MGIEFQFFEMKSFVDWMHSSVNVLRTTELYLKMVKMVNFTISVFLYLKIILIFRK